jgi:RNA polymerase sigma-70 factor (ECF subfamily)
MEWESLVQQHQRMVYRIAFSVLRNHHDAEDAAQEAFLKVFRNAAKLDEVIDAKGWVARIAWNAALDRKRQSRPAEVSAEDLTRGIQSLRDGGRSPEEIAGTSEMQRLLAQIIRTLPAKLRDALTLSTVEDLGYAEVAVALETSEAAIRARVFQARKQIKEKLDRMLGVEVEA